MGPLASAQQLRDVTAGVQTLVEGGARELTLLGQNVSAWSGEDAKGHRTGLAGLVRELAKIDGLGRIRYTTSHPADMDDEPIGDADDGSMTPDEVAEADGEERSEGVRRRRQTRPPEDL